MNIKKLVAAATVAAMSLFSVAAFAQAEKGGAASITDPQIVGVVTAANQIDIAQAKLALKKNKVVGVKQSCPADD